MSREFTFSVPEGFHIMNLHQSLPLKDGSHEWRVYLKVNRFDGEFACGVAFSIQDAIDQAHRALLASIAKFGPIRLSSPNYKPKPLPQLSGLTLNLVGLRIKE